ncbi:MAG: endo-1,4-beta-xylanase [Treponema sp.]|jgi:endo-1,4-beta-xylanase|nr:endo-1,4-beta-xylanase [Treponema sp.]
MKNQYPELKNKLISVSFRLLLLTAFLPVLSTCSTTQSVPGNTLTDGLCADAPSYDIISLPLEQRQDVMKVKGKTTQWAVVKYSLAEYKGKEITIHISADVKREGAAGNLIWQVNNSDYPSLSYLENAPAGVWHHMRGRRILTPTDSDPYIYLTNWENNAAKTVYYIDNFTVTIEEGNMMEPDLTLPQLKSAYKNDFLIGNIIDMTYAAGKYFDLLKHHYNVVTTTETYPVQLAPSEKGGEYKWTRADAVIELARSNGILLHGHILAWHESSPAWLTSGTRAEVEQNLKDYITTVLTHFKGKYISWDVVNEAMQENPTAGDWKKCVRNTENPWYNKLGPDYIEIAFRAARAADPDITLYYNDYFHMDGYYSQDSIKHAFNKIEAVRKMIDDINTRYRNETGGTRNLIEGVGIQSHHFGFGLNLNNLRECLEKFSTLGIEMAISELDISVTGFARGSGNDTDMSEADEIAQAKLYAGLFKLYREYSSYISRVTWWGMDDGTSWLSPGNPCLFNWKLEAKKAFYAVSDPDAFLAGYANN